MLKSNPKNIVKILKNGGIGVLPTDTLYGMVGSALNPLTVEKIYSLRKRTPTKPMIILISSINDLKLFSFPLSKWEIGLLKKIWPNPVSVVLNCDNPDFEYLHRGSRTLAFRMPNNKSLLKLLKQTGPLVAPSANFEGKKPVTTINEAKNYFGDSIGFYVDGGKLESMPSTLVRIARGKIEVIRQGIFKLANIKDL